jgi:hypothetical protein
MLFDGRYSPPGSQIWCDAIFKPLLFLWGTGWLKIRKPGAKEWLARWGLLLHDLASVRLLFYKDPTGLSFPVIFMLSLPA